jgi:Ca2+/Na+ antiporter
MIFMAGLLMIALFDGARFSRMLHVPLRLFEAPVLLFALNGHNYLLHGPILVILLLTNVLAIVGMIVLIKRRAVLERYQVITGISCAVCAIFLSNPLLGLEWANRLFTMAYVPLTILYLVVFNQHLSRWARIPMQLVFILLLWLAFARAFRDRPPLAITNEALIEFQQVKDKSSFKQNDAVVSRQDLRLLANWCYGTKGVSDYLLTKTEFRKYGAVYFIRQIQGSNLIPRGISMHIPANYELVYQGHSFEVYRIMNDADLPANPEKIFKGVIGTIVKISGRNLLVKDANSGTTREVLLPENLQKSVDLHLGMKVEVNGEWTPFSLAIRAATIKEISSF